MGANRSQSGRSRHNLKDPFRVLPIEILCTKLRELWTKNGGVLSINVFWTHPPHGGARRAACEKCWAEVLKSLVSYVGEVKNEGILSDALLDVMFSKTSKMVGTALFHSMQYQHSQ